MKPTTHRKGGKNHLTITEKKEEKKITKKTPRKTQIKNRKTLKKPGTKQKET